MGAKILRLDSLEQIKHANFVAVLLANGTGEIAPTSRFLQCFNEVPEEGFDLRPINSFLKQQELLLDDQSQMIPSISKYWFQEGLGDIPVWPGSLAFLFMSKHLKGHVVPSHPFGVKDLAFVIPAGQAKTSKRMLELFGNRLCSSMCSQDGPDRKSVV